MTPQDFEYARQIARDAIARMKVANDEAAADERRPITATEIASLEGTALVWRVSRRINFITRQRGEHPGSPEVRAVLTLVHLDGEVSNGGLHQYFWNTQALELDALNDAAAILHASAREVILEAIDRAKRYAYRRTWLMMRWRWWWTKQFVKGYSEKRFDDLDDRYDALSPSVIELLAAFIRQRPSAFIDEA
jgi:hypothetical protein